MHKLLLRQIEKYFGKKEDLPGAVTALCDAISRTYDDHDKDLALIERSLNISSRELQEANERLRQEVLNEKKRGAELEKFNKLMVNREVKMIALKKEIKHLKHILAETKNT